MRACAICGDAQNNRVVVAREMMLGLRDVIEYLDCHSCGCIQLLDKPSDWSRYYPRGYYAFSTAQAGALKRIFKRARARHALGYRSVLGALFVKRWGNPPFVDWVGPAKLQWNSSVLDVGSGSGHVLLEMSYAGFSNLTGVDPYVPHDMQPRPGLRILKRHLSEVEGVFDFVMMNHSLEHMEEPERELADVARLLQPEGTLLIRIPVAGKKSWQEYGTDWVQLDPPRHVFVHSERSLGILADRVGMTITEVRYDSTGFQFWASEQYRRDIPLQDPRSFAVNPKRSVFTPVQIAEYEQRAAELNLQGEGDQACFYLVKSSRTSHAPP